MNDDTPDPAPELDVIAGEYRIYRSPNGRTYAKRGNDPHAQGRDVMEDPLILALAEELQRSRQELQKFKQQPDAK